jgi:tetratricopeptide (TPR) repeat protein
LAAVPVNLRPGWIRDAADTLVHLHRITEARALLQPFGTDAEFTAVLSKSGSGGVPQNAMAARSMGDWQGAYDQLAALEQSSQTPDRAVRFKSAVETMALPLMAEALAHLGRIEEAQALAAKGPADCYRCLIARGQVAAIAGQPAEADRWFAAALRQGPSLVSAPTEWGQALLARGQADAAIEKLKIANRIGPRFADPLELWGEALMAKGDFKGGVGKFRDANSHAPQWGRLHLKWGEALAKLGKADQARAQFATAAKLDLTPAERAELAQQKV